MKKLVMFIPIALLFLLAACGDDNGTSAQREEFREQVEDQIAEFNQRIEDARERSEELSGNAKDEMNKTIERLEEQRDNLVTQLEEMREASDDKWRAAKQDVERAIDELEQTLRDLQRGFGRSLSSSGPRRS